MNRIEAYGLAYKLALENAGELLDLAQGTFHRKHYGHAYSLAVLANEEIVKAYVSWGVSQKYISPDHDLVTDVYSSHIEKNMISLDFHYEIIVQEALKAGFIDWEEALVATVTVSPMDAAKALHDHAIEMELRRRSGVYVERPRKVDGKYSVMAPKDFPRNRAENLIGLVRLFHNAVKILLEAVEIDEGVRDWFENTADKIDHWRILENKT